MCNLTLILFLLLQIVNQFLFLSAGSAALTKLKGIIRTPEDIPSFLAESLPAQSTFFICYIMLRTFTGLSLELLRIIDLVIIPIKRRWFCYTPREDEAAWRPPYVLYDRVVCPPPLPPPPTHLFDRGQTREICEKQEKYFKGKVVTLTVQSLILYQYPVDLLTFFLTLLKKF